MGLTRASVHMLLDEFDHHQIERDTIEFVIDSQQPNCHPFKAGFEQLGMFKLAKNKLCKICREPEEKHNAKPVICKDLPTIPLKEWTETQPSSLQSQDVIPKPEPSEHE